MAIDISADSGSVECLQPRKKPTIAHNGGPFALFEELDRQNQPISYSVAYLYFTNFVRQAC